MSQILLGKIIRVILQKKEGVYKVVKFKDFSKPNEDIKYFLRTLTEFKDSDFSRRLVKFKTFSRLNGPSITETESNAKRRRQRKRQKK